MRPNRGLGVAAERLDLSGRELPPLPRQKIAERQATDCHPLELMYFVAELGKHPTNLAVLAFVEDHLEHSALLVLTSHRNALGVNFALCEPHAPSQAVDEIGGRDARDLHEILLLDTIPRMRQQVCEVTIIGEQNEPFTRSVEPSNGKQPTIIWHEVHHSWPTRGVVVRRHDTHRLVEEKDDTPWIRQSLTVNTDLLGPRIDFCAECRDDLPVDLDAACRHEVFAGSTASEASCREHLLETFEAITAGSWSGPR